MLKIGQVSKRLLLQGFVCIVDDYEDEAVRLEMNGSKVLAYLKRKGRNEVKSSYECDTVQNIIHELNNREITREEYDNY